MKPSIILCFICSLCRVLHAAPPDIVPSVGTVTVNPDSKSVVYPDAAQLVQVFTSSTRATTAPRGVGQLGFETDTYLFYRGVSTAAGAWTQVKAAWSDITGTPTTLGSYGITDAQALDSDLTSIAALTTTSFGRGLLTESSASTTRTTLGLTTTTGGGGSADSGKVPLLNAYGGFDLGNISTVAPSSHFTMLGSTIGYVLQVTNAGVGTCIDTSPAANGTGFQCHQGSGLAGFAVDGTGTSPTSFAFGTYAHGGILLYGGNAAGDKDISLYPDGRLIIRNDTHSISFAAPAVPADVTIQWPTATGTLLTIDSNGMVDYGNSCYIAPDGTATVQLGQDAATPAAQVLKGADGSGTDKNGGTLSIRAGRNTGAGTPGLVSFATGTTGSSGATLSAYTTQVIVRPQGTEVKNLIFTPVTLSFISPLTLDLAAGGLSSVTISADTTFQTTNLGAGRSKTLRIICDSLTRNLTFPAGWKFVGGSAPASIAANKTAILKITSFSTDDANVIATYLLEP